MEKEMVKKDKILSELEELIHAVTMLEKQVSKEINQIVEQQSALSTNRIEMESKNLSSISNRLIEPISERSLQREKERSFRLTLSY